MKVTIPKTFTLEVDYDEAYLLRAALLGLSPDSVSAAGGEARRSMLNQIEGLISLASGATADAIPFR